MSTDPLSDGHAARRPWASLGLRLSISVALCVWAFGKADLSKIGDIFVQADANAVLAAYGLWLGATVLAACRWYLLVRHEQSQPPGLVGVISDSFLGLFAGLALPTQVGGDVVRIAALARRGIKASEAGSSVLMDRAIGTVGLLLLSLAGLLGGSSSGARRLVLVGAGLVALGLGVFVAALMLPALRGAARRLLVFARLQRMQHTLASAYRICQGYLLSWRLMVATLALSLVVQSLAVLANWAAAHALGIQMSLGAAFSLFPGILLLTMVAPVVNGIGVRDNLLVWGLGTVGATRNGALALSAINLLATFAVALPGCISVLHLGLRGLRAR